MACLVAGNPATTSSCVRPRRRRVKITASFTRSWSIRTAARFEKVQVRRLVDDAVLGSDLGAKIVWLDSSDVVGELLQFARQSDIGRIFVARNRPTLFSQLFGRAVYSELLSRAEGFRMDVVGFERGN